MPIRKLAAAAGLLLGSTAGVIACTVPVARADDQAFLSQVYLYAHPSLTGPRLLELGHRACSVRRAGQTTDAAKNELYKTLAAQGVLSSNAEIGSLVHVAVDTLCPEVGYP